VAKGSKTSIKYYLSKETTAPDTKLQPVENINTTIPKPPVTNPTEGSSSSTGISPFGTTPKTVDPSPAIPSVAVISVSERRTIYGILETPGMELSPRLFKRFINIYLIARDLHFTQQARLEKETTPPDPSMTRWLALSVAYPFEAKRLIQWLEDVGWRDPLVDNLSLFSEPEGSSEQLSGATRWSNFGEVYQTLKIDHKVVQNTKHITNCFNLVLD
jgi:hypothetical protein